MKLENVSTCDVVYVCTKWRGKIQPSDDVAALEWKPLEFLNSPNFAWEYKGVYEKLKSYTDHLI